MARTEHRHDRTGTAAAAVTATASRERAAAVVVGLLPRSSLSCHWRGSSLLTFFK